MSLSPAQMDQAVTEAMSKLPELQCETPFYQIGFSGHGCEVSFTTLAGLEEFVSGVEEDGNSAKVEASRSSLAITMTFPRPHDVPAHVPDYIVQELFSEIVAKSMSLKYNIPVVPWNEVAFNAAWK